MRNVGQRGLTCGDPARRLSDRPWLILGIVYLKEDIDPTMSWFLLKVFS